MRILFVPAPLIGHLFPMVPLAVAVREAGHEVRVAAGGDAAAARPAGLEVDDVVPGFDFSRIEALRTCAGVVREEVAALSHLAAVLCAPLLAAAFLGAALTGAARAGRLAAFTSFDEGLLANPIIVMDPEAFRLGLSTRACSPIQ